MNIILIFGACLFLMLCLLVVTAVFVSFGEQEALREAEQTINNIENKPTMEAKKLVEEIECIRDIRALEVWCGIHQIPLPDYDIGCRGGYLRLLDTPTMTALGQPVSVANPYIAVYVDYMGGGVRSEIRHTPYGESPVRTALIETLERCYEKVEQCMGLTDETDCDGETNWDNLCTASVRKSYRAEPDTITT